MTLVRGAAAATRIQAPDAPRDRRAGIRLFATLAFAVAVSVSIQPAAAQPDRNAEAERIARAYVAAYSAADWDGMAPYMAPDFVLIDRTNPDPGFQPEYRTPATALGMLRTFGRDGGVHALDFDFPTVFASNGVVVFQGYVNTRSTPPGRAATFVWRARQVTIITIRDGRVERHEDLADYAHAVVSRAPAAP